MSTELSISVAQRRLHVPLAELDFQFARSSGPGGQNVNKVNTKALLRWNPGKNDSLPDDVRARLLRHISNRLTRHGDLVIISQRYRDQGRNVADCLEKLRALIAGAAVPRKTRKATRPGKGAVQRRLADKSARKIVKQRRREARSSGEE